MLLIFNDIAGSEIMLILVFILIFFGSKSIPTLARTLGKTIRQVKDASSDIQNEIKKSAGDIKGDLNLKGILEDTVEEVKRPLDQYAQDIDNAVKYESPRKKVVQTPSEIDEEIVANDDSKNNLTEVRDSEIKDSDKTSGKTED